MLFHKSALSGTPLASVKQAASQSVQPLQKRSGKKKQKNKKGGPDEIKSFKMFTC